MRDRARYTEYLAEVCEQVCHCCPERAPATSRCWCCGVRCHLPQLVEWIRTAGEQLDEFGVNRSMMRRLVWAVNTVDEHREQQEDLRRRLRQPALPQRVPVREMIQAYEEATGICIGCD